MGKGARRPSRGRNKAHQLYTPPRFNRFLPRAKCSHSWFINHRRFSPKRFSPQSPRSRRLATCRSAPKTTDVHFRCVNAQLRSPPNSRPCGSTCLSPPSHTHTGGRQVVCVSGCHFYLIKSNRCLLDSRPLRTCFVGFVFLRFCACGRGSSGPFSIFFL